MSHPILPNFLPLSPAFFHGRRYQRFAVRTHFIQIGEDPAALFRQYVLPLFRSGDIVAVSEKVAALCQGRVIRREEITVTPLARLLAACVRRTPAGPGMGLPVKMQFALDLCGRRRVLWAALRAGWDKLRGIHGTFYRLLDPEVRGLDGFYGREFPEYADLGIRLPHEPDAFCDELFQAAGIPCFLVDANDLGVRLLGRCAALEQPDEELLALVADNPAGQDRRLTPFILCRLEPCSQTM